jgi:predicted MFS family arabinose efflux permease
MPPMTRGLIVLLAVAAGAAVGNLYWAQPLLEIIARDLHASTGTAGWLVTVTQLGYALGVLLIVPLGDILNRRRLIPAMLLLCAVALAACAAAPTFAALLGAIAVLGLTTVSGQIILPLAGDMAPEGERGRVIGTVTSGALTGILVSRSISGLVAGVSSWRVIYAAAAVLAVVLAGLLHRRIPTLPARQRIGYGTLLASVARAVGQQRTIRWSLVLSATQFGLFTMFWTALTFYLSAAPYNYPVTVIGLFGLFGLAGALAAQRAGRLHDRGWSLPATGAGWALVLASFALAGFARTSLAILIASIVLLDIAIQSLNILNATRLFAIAGNARSRVNTSMITSNFVAGSIGSAAAGLLWTAGGWSAVTTTELTFAAFGFTVWLLGRRGPLVIPRADPQSPRTRRNVGPG